MKVRKMTGKGLLAERKKRLQVKMEARLQRLTSQDNVDSSLLLLLAACYYLFFAERGKGGEAAPWPAEHLIFAEGCCGAARALLLL